MSNTKKKGNVEINKNEYHEKNTQKEKKTNEVKWDRRQINHSSLIPLTHTRSLCTVKKAITPHRHDDDEFVQECQQR